MLLLWLASGFYVVGPGERGVVLLFGRVVTETAPGLRYRLPWPIQTHQVVDVARVRRVEVGFRTRAGATEPVPRESLMLTGDENIVDVHLFAQYLVQDPVRFLFRARDPERALHASAEVALRAAVGENTIEKRAAIMETVTAATRELAAPFGIQVVDVRVKRADLPPEVQASVFARMQAERQRIAMRYRAEGDERAREIILAKAYADSQRLRGEGDAQATAVTGRAFGQDPGFYGFLRRLETYERIFAQGTTVLLRPDSDLLRYLESPRPRR